MEFLDWIAPWMGGSAAAAFLLDRPDLGWQWIVLSVSALAGRYLFRRRKRS